MIFSDLPSPAEAGFAKAGNRFPLFGIMLYMPTMMNSSHEAGSGLSAVRAEIERACREASRDPAGVTLIAVSKTFGAEAIEPVIAAGQKVFGENRVQEANAKWPALQAKHPGLQLHMVGSLQ